MIRDELIDLYALIQASDNRDEISEADIVIWQQVLGDLSADDCLDAVMAHFREQPGVWLQPGHIRARVRARKADELARMDPDERAGAVAAHQRTPRDRYGYVDKAAPEDGEYPAEFTPAQRVQAYWQRLQEHRDMREYEQAIAHPRTLSPTRPATASQRAKAMALVASHQYALDELTEGAPYVNPLTVRCGFCGAPQGDQCTVAGMPGQPREQRVVAHPMRIQDAGRKAGLDEHQINAILLASCKAAVAAVGGRVDA